MSTPAAHWRAIVRSGMPQVPGDDQEFHSYLREHLRAATGLEHFVLAVGLLTFGQLDAVAAILDEVPAVGHPARMLARSVDDLLPTGANVLADPAATRRWLAEHREALDWDEQGGRFRLRS